MPKYKTTKISLIPDVDVVPLNLNIYSENINDSKIYFSSIYILFLNI